jgi:hypothetical protein
MLHISDKITTDFNLSANGYLSYLGILLSLKKGETEYLVTAETLSYLLTKKLLDSTLLSKAITDGIANLSKNKMLEIIATRKKTLWVINTTNIKSGKTGDYFTSIEESAIRKILLSNELFFTRSISVLRFYIYLLSTLYKNKCEYTGVGFTPINRMSKEFHLNPKTTGTYLKLLEELELIYVYRSKDMIRFDTGEIKEISPTYGRYEDKEKIIEIGKKHESQYGMNIQAKFHKINRAKADETRVSSQKYFHIIKCLGAGKEIPYHYDECEKIYNDMIKFNERYKDRPDRLKDLSIFSRYDFYHTE